MLRGAILRIKKGQNMKLTTYEERIILEARGLRELAEDLRNKKDYITEEEYELALLNDGEEKECQI